MIRRQVRRPLFLSFVLAALLGLVPSWAYGANSWLMSGHDAAQTRFNTGSGAMAPAAVNTLHSAWIFPDVVQAIATDRRVFAVLTEHPPGGPKLVVVVLNARTGALLRKFTAQTLGVPGNTTSAQLAYGHGHLVIAMNPAIVAVNPDSGRQYWRVGDGASTVTISSTTVFTGKGCQYACGGTLNSDAIALQSGRVLWRHPGNGGGIPTFVGGRLYQNWSLSDTTGETRVYDPASGTLVARLPWNATWTGTRINAYAAVWGTNTTPRVRTWIGQVGPTGKPVWKADTGHASYTPPVLANGTLYTASNRFHPGLIALKANTGHLQWALDLGDILRLTASNRFLFVIHGRNGQIDVLQAQTGKTVRQLRLPGYPSAAPYDIFVASSTLYVIGGKGLTALRP